MAISSAGRLYRILSFDRAVQVFERGELHFAHPSTWADPYEVRLQHAVSHQLFGQCWCTKGVSDAMWRIYSPNHLGVRISTSTKKLHQALATVAKTKGCILRLSEVDYKSQHDINLEMRAVQADLKERFTTERAMDALFLKREAFDHESEYRAVIHFPSAIEENVRDGIKVRVDPHRLIDSVLLDPRAPPELAAAFAFYFTDKIKFKKRVAPSVLYKSQTPFMVEEE